MNNEEDFNLSTVVDPQAAYMATVTFLPDWLDELAKDNPSAVAFFYRFRLRYGGLRNGVYKDQENMAAEMGMPHSTFKKHLKTCVEVGAISKGRRHRKWSGSIYFFNGYPHEHDELAKAYHLVRQYPQAAPLNLPDTKYRATPEKAEALDLSACTSVDNAYQMLAKHYSKLMEGQESFTKALLLNFLNEGGNIKQAVNGLYELRAKGYKISQAAFDNSLKERGDFIPQHLEVHVNKQRDKVTSLLRAEQAAVMEAKNRAYMLQDRARREAEQEMRRRKAEEEQLREPSQEAIDAELERMLEGLEL